MAEVVLTPRAEADIAERIAYLRRFSQAAARGFEFAVKSTLCRLTALPEMGTLWKTKRKQLKGIRVVTIPKYRNYCIFFRPLQDTVLS
jgi:plasmid stabilization system protein ParE